MKLTRHDILKITNRSRKNFIDQPARIYWKTDKGDVELTYSDKRFVAMLEAFGVELGIELELEYDRG